MNTTLSTLEAELTAACDKAMETPQEPEVAVHNKAHIVAVCERNRARIRFTQEQNDTSVATVRNAHNKVNMALLWWTAWWEICSMILLLLDAFRWLLWMCLVDISEIKGRLD